MRVRILTEVPVLPRQTLVAGVPNIIPTHGMNGLTDILDGTGAVDVHTWQDGCWRKHPQGSGITDDGESARLVIGDDQVYACMVANGEVPEETIGRLSACTR